MNSFLKKLGRRAAGTWNRPRGSKWQKRQASKSTRRERKKVVDND